MVHPPYKPSKTTVFFYKICFILYIVGFPNFWIENLKLSKRFVVTYDRINFIKNTLVFLLFFFQAGAFYTQNNMNEKVRLYQWLHTFSALMYGLYYLILMYRKKRIRNVLYSLTVHLKALHNDPVVERQMIKKSFMYLTAVTFNYLMTMLLINVEGLTETIHHNVPFTTIVTAYPDIYDGSRTANMCRVIINIIWWIFISRSLGIYLLVTLLTVGLGYQYKNLRKYFYGLSEIFERQDLSQEERVTLYEKHFKLGIKMHLETRWCTREINTICNEVFSGQIITNVLLLVILMAQMVQSGRNLANLLSALSTASAVLFTTGLFMWNAGDITVEASHLATAIYFSGWHNCRGQSSTRIRKLVSITITFAQRPVVLKGLGYIGLSYQFYLTIVKSSYSVFSVLY